MSGSRARDEILARVRRSLGVPADAGSGRDEVGVDWSYGQPTALASVLDTFEENILDYGASLTRVSSDAVGSAVSSALRGMGTESVVVPVDLPVGWLQGWDDLLVVVDSEGLSSRDLDGIDAVVTGSLVSAAETGTICLDHGAGQGRRAISLVPDRHVCVVAADSVVSDIPEAVALLEASVRQGRPVTWISGGSATSDIELSRVEGVHGPRQLHVVLVV
jgi:L-lactate dehydrogenase complex protein LldG